MKFVGICILNPLKPSGGQPVALGGFGVWLGGYFLAWVLIDTTVHRTLLIMCLLLVNLTTLFL